ncbi:MAG: hypothetical protein KC619_16040 [Myxococcales bacterium]|nr:hypothetical protein [Myxococcales bacterium]
MKSRLLLVLIAGLVGGCSLLVEGEVKDLEPNLNAKRDVRVTMLDMNPHIGQLFDVQIIRPGDPMVATSRSQIEAHAVIRPLPTPCFELNWPLGTSLGATRVDFYADLNMDGMVSPPGDDHLWRRDLMEEPDGTGFIDFIHDVMFDDIGADPAIATMADLTIDLTGLDDHEGELLVVSVTRDFRESPGAPVQRSTPGILVVGSIAGGVVSETLTGVLDQGSDYTIDFDFAEGTTVCRNIVTANASGATITSLDAFDCGVTNRLVVFRDVSDERRCTE